MPFRGSSTQLRSRLSACPANAGEARSASLTIVLNAHRIPFPLCSICSRESSRGTPRRDTRSDGYRLLCHARLFPFPWGPGALWEDPECFLRDFAACSTNVAQITYCRNLLPHLGLDTPAMILGHEAENQSPLKNCKVASVLTKTAASTGQQAASGGHSSPERGPGAAERGGASTPCVPRRSLGTRSGRAGLKNLYDKGRVAATSRMLPFLGFSKPELPLRP